MCSSFSQAHRELAQPPPSVQAPASAIPLAFAQGIPQQSAAQHERCRLECLSQAETTREDLGPLTRREELLSRRSPAKSFFCVSPSHLQEGLPAPGWSLLALAAQHRLLKRLPEIVP